MQKNKEVEEGFVIDVAVLHQNEFKKSLVIALKFGFFFIFCLNFRSRGHYFVFKVLQICDLVIFYSRDKPTLPFHWLFPLNPFESVSF